MSLASLKQLLKKGDVPELVLVFGEEPYFVDQAVAMIQDFVIAPDVRDFNFTLFHGRDFKPFEVIELARTFPVFAPRRLIHVKSLQAASTEQLDGLLPYLADPAPETVLLMTADKVDARRKFFQEIRKAGYVLEFKKVYDNQLPSHVKHMATAEGLSFTADALRLFCRRVGTNLAEVQGELVKLSSYLGEVRLVEESDVAAVVSDTRSESVFMLVDAIGRGRQEIAFRLLHRLLEEGQAPLMILAMIVRHFRQMWKASSLLGQGVSQKEIPRRAGINPYFVKGVMEQAQRYDDQEFRRAFDLFLTTDLALKSSGGEPRAHMEKLVLLLGQLGRQ